MHEHTYDNWLPAIKIMHTYIYLCTYADVIKILYFFRFWISDQAKNVEQFYQINS